MHFILLYTLHNSAIAGSKYTFIYARLISGHDTMQDSDFNTFRDTVADNDSFRRYAVILVGSNFEMV